MAAEKEITEEEVVETAFWPPQMLLEFRSVMNGYPPRTPGERLAQEIRDKDPRGFVDRLLREEDRWRGRVTELSAARAALSTDKKETVTDTGPDEGTERVEEMMARLLEECT